MLFHNVRKTQVEDFLKNPLSLFDVRGKIAIVTGASGAFGALAAKVLAGAGCNLVLADGGVDILVLASGINKVSKIVDQSPETFMEVIDVNVTQSWLMARAAGKQMLAQGRGGKVGFMSSGRGLLGHPAGYT